jgi:lipopolysaccharide export system permease protein
MMILDRYLAGAVVGGSLVTLAVLLPLLGFFILAEEIENLGAEGYGLGQVLLVMAFTLPRYAYEVLPIATLIGALVGLGALAGRSELVAIRAAGVSVGRIVFAGLLGGLVLAALGVAIGELLTPPAEQRAQELKRTALSGEATQGTPYGLWAIDDGAYVNIREILSGTEIKDIFIYQIDSDAGTLVATHAERARYRDDDQWVLEGLSRSRAGPEGVTVERMDSSVWASMLDPGLLKVVVVDPRALPAWSLWKYIRFMRTNEQDARSYEVVFWGKVVYPLLTLSMIFVSAPILLGSARSRGLGTRMLLGVMAGIAYYVLSRTFTYLALLYDFSPLAAALAPPVIFIAAAILLLRRIG